MQDKQYQYWDPPFPAVLAAVSKPINGHRGDEFARLLRIIENYKGSQTRNTFSLCYSGEALSRRANTVGPIDKSCL